MGWKLSTIIINQTSNDHQQLLTDLGFKNVSRSASQPFGKVCYPYDNKLYIGTYKGNTIICVDEYPMFMVEQDSTPLAESLHQHFPEAEITALVLHSVVNLWGFSVRAKGKLLRAKGGSSDDGTFIEKGDPLKEEQILLSSSHLDEDGNRVYQLNDFPDELLDESVVGEDFVFAIAQRYLGIPLHMDEELSDLMMEGYAFGKFKTSSGSDDLRSSHGSHDKPWWRFWK
jgi:hypothetical protein